MFFWIWNHYRSGRCWSSCTWPKTVLASVLCLLFPNGSNCDVIGRGFWIILWIVLYSSPLQSKHTKNPSIGKWVNTALPTPLNHPHTCICHGDAEMKPQQFQDGLTQIDQKAVFWHKDQLAQVALPNDWTWSFALEIFTLRWERVMDKQLVWHWPMTWSECMLGNLGTIDGPCPFIQRQSRAASW